MSSKRITTKNNQKLPEQHTKQIEKAAAENDLKDFEIEADFNLTKGDNFVGQIVKVRVKDKNSKEVIHLVLKCTNAESLFESTGLFVRESLMYIDILPQLLKYQSDANISNPFKGVAKCYGNHLETNVDGILMEDLMARGFKMWNKRYPMEADHVAITFAEYAKFHAISLAVAQNYPEKFEKWTAQLPDVWKADDEEGVQTFINMLSRMKSNAMNCLKDEHLKKEFDETWDSVALKMLESAAETLRVVTHGDSWCNNIMYAYDGEEVNRVCFVDWQLSKVGTPIWDLVYFFYVSASKEVLNNYKKFLELYYKILSENLKEFGCDIEEILTYEELLKKWNKYASMGLFCALMTGKVLQADSDDIPDDLKSQMGEDFRKSFNDVVVFDKKKQAIYEQRITDLIRYMLDHKFLTKYKILETNQMLKESN